MASRQSKTQRVCRVQAQTQGFTLVELLTVIGIIAVLAAILFPVFATVRGKARQTSCQSNLRQIGMAVTMYAQDYDSLLPYALDASDVNVTQMWQFSPPACYQAVQEMKTNGQVLHWHRQPLTSNNWVPGVLDSYLKSRDIWRCAGDTGFSYLDNNDSCNGPCAMPSHPSMYEAHGASYLWRTALGVALQNVDNITGTTPDGKEVGPANINLLFDGNGSWHGSSFSLGRGGLRYITLFVDGHAKLLPYDDYNKAWQTTLPPSHNGPCP